MKLINATPHQLKIEDSGGQIITLDPSNIVARLAANRTACGTVGDITLYATTYGDLTPLPPPDGESFYIVSLLYLTALRATGDTRQDVASPGELIRDLSGNVIGCRGLSI